MEPERKSNGALIGLIVIIVILIVGGIYFWQNNLKVKEKGMPQDQDVSSDIKDLLESGNNFASSIETELNSINLDSLDEEI